MYRRILSLTVVVVLFLITPAGALALSGDLVFALKTHTSFAVFSQKRDRPTCAIYDVQVSTGTQVAFDANNQPPYKKSTWLSISITTMDCDRNPISWLDLLVDPLPTDKKNMYDPKEFGQSAELQANLKIPGTDGKVHRVKLVMLLENNGITSAHGETGFNYSYIQTTSPAIGIATLTIDNKTILKETKVVSDPPAYNDDSTYISRN